MAADRRRLLLALASVPVAWPPAAGQSETVFRSSVALVRVDAQVMDGMQVVSGLEKEDFQISDQQQLQPILYLGKEEDPLDLFLLLDVSRSLRPAISEVSRMAGAALAQLRPGDRVALGTFTSTFRLVVPFTDDLAGVGAAVEVLLAQPFEGGTDILRALEEAAASFSRQPASARRRAVILISDGKAPHYFRDQQTIDRLWRADAVMHALLVPTRSKPSSLPLDLDKMTAATGGEAIRTDRPGPAFQNLMERVRRRYSLFYARPEGIEGERRLIRVDLTPAARKRLPKARVHTRSGYLWTAGP